MPQTSPQRGTEPLSEPRWARVPLRVFRAVNAPFGVKVWCCATLAFLAVDAYCAKRGWTTFSKTTRYVFHTDTPNGKRAFRTALAVLDRHILE